MANIDTIVNGEAASGVRTKLNELITRSNECYPCTGGSGSLSADITSAMDIGGVSAGDVFLAGTTLDEIMQSIFTQTFTPTLIAPSVNFTASLASAVEAGTTADLILAASLNRGQIRGAMIGGVWNSSATPDYRSGPATSTTIEGVVSGGSRTLPAYQIIDGANTFSASIAHSVGPQPLNSDGVNFSSPLPAGSVAATLTIQGRRMRFHGTPASIPATSADVRALPQTALNPTTGSSFTINIAPGSTHVAFAYPASLGAVSSVRYVEGLNAEVKGIFTESTLPVEGASGYNPINYRLYTYTPATPFGSAATYTVVI